jgi:hypothetical protein
MGVVYEIPEWFTGLVGALMIALSLVSSIRANKKELDGECYA